MKRRLHRIDPARSRAVFYDQGLFERLGSSERIAWSNRAETHHLCPLCFWPPGIFVLSWVPMYCSGLPGMFHFFRQMLKQFFLHLSVIHILFDLAPSLAWDSSYSIPRYSKHWLRVQLTIANPLCFGRSNPAGFLTDHLATWLPG